VTRTLLVFVEDPGAANAVIGLPARLAARGVATRVVVTGAATTFLTANGAVFETLAPDDTPASLIDRTCPDAVFIGTAENPDTLALGLVREAKLRGLPSVGFVDAVSCVDHRFRGRTEDPLASCPDHVLVCDGETRDAFVYLGVAPGQIEVCGYPQFDALLARAGKLAEEDRSALRRRVFPALPYHAYEARPVVVFCGERSTGGFGDAAFDAQFRRSNDYTLEGRGATNSRTEIVAEELLDALGTLPDRPFSVLRYHPKNRAEDFGVLNEEFDALSIGGAPLEVIYAADLVVGMSSMILLEASLVGSPTLSIVTRPAEREWLPYLARDATPTVNTRDALRSFLEGWARTKLPSRRPPTAHGSSSMARLLASIVGTPGNSSAGK